MNFQRGFIAIPWALITYAVLFLAFAGLVAGAIYKVRHWCNDACENVKEELASVSQDLEALKQEKAEVMRREANIAMLWYTEVQSREQDLARRSNEREARFEPIRVAATRLPPEVGRVVFPQLAVELLDRAVAAANQSFTGPPAGTQETPAATASSTPSAVYVENVTSWGVDVANLYAKCLERVTGWATFYSNLQDIQLKEQVH